MRSSKPATTAGASRSGVRIVAIDGVATPGQLASGFGAEAARRAGDQHDVAGRPVVLGRRWRVGVQRSAPRTQRPAAPQPVPLLVGAAGPDRRCRASPRSRPASASAAVGRGRRCRRGRRRRSPRRDGWRRAAGSRRGARRPTPRTVRRRRRRRRRGSTSASRWRTSRARRMHTWTPSAPTSNRRPSLERLEGELGRRVVRQHRRHDPSRQRRDVDDLAPATTAHLRERGLDHPPRPERVRVELAPQLLLGAELGRPVQPEAGVVDQHVDAAVRRHGGGHDGLDLGRHGHVEPGRVDPVLEAGDDRRRVPARVAHRRHDRVAAAGDQAGGRRAEAAGGPRDEHDLGIHVRPDARQDQGALSL